MKKKDKLPDAADWSRDAYLTNPVASVTEATGTSPAMPRRGGEGEARRSLTVKPTAKDGKK